MPDGVEHNLEAQRQMRERGWREVGVGAGIVGLAIALAVKGDDILELGKMWVYFGAFSFVIVGFAVIALGLSHVLRFARQSVEGAHPDSAVGFGFRSVVAWRYLMARDARVSRIVAYTAVGVAFLAVAAAFAEKKIIVQIAITHPAWLDKAWFNDLVTAIAITKVAAPVLFFFAVIVGALRYVFSFYTTVPLVGVWIGTGALVCVLSVMSGFESDLREKILGSNAHIQITREDGDFTDWRNVKAQIDRIPGVVASTPYAVSEVVIAANNNGMNVIIKGIDPATVGQVTELVKDLEDHDAMKRLEPLIDEPHDLRVPQAPKRDHVVDPPPSDMPTGGDPIDFSAGSDDASGSDSGSADPSREYIVDEPPAREEVTDPPPSDLITSDEQPEDFSGEEGSGGPLPTINASDFADQPPSRRTQALPGILVGRELVKQTHLYNGEEVRVVSPLSDPANPDATGTPIPFNRDYRVAGVFFTGMYEYDLKYVYVTLDSLDEFLDRGDSIDGIEVRVPSPDDSDAYVQTISAALGPHYRVQDWKELNRSLFSALKLEKYAMFLVLGIVILVASFAIVGNLIMVVVEKQREIAVLKTLGASDGRIMQIFAIQGLMIGLIGTALGVVTGLAACLVGKTIGIPLNPDVYYIDRMPVHVETNSVILTAAAGVLISMAATFYPSLMAARVRPAIGMRH